MADQQTTPPPAQDAGAAGGTEGPNSADWLSSIPEDFRDQATLGVFKAQGPDDLVPVPKDLVKSYVHASKLVGRDKIPMPKPDSPPEEWKAFYAKLGVPDKPDAYKLELPKNVPPDVIPDEGFLKDFAARVHKYNLTPQQAQGLLNELLDYNAKQLSEGQQILEQSQQQALQELKRTWGSATEERIRQAQQLVANYADPELVELLDATGLSNSPAMIKFMANLASQFAEDAIKGTYRVKMGVIGPEEARQELRQKLSDPDFRKAYYELPKHDPTHKEAVAYVSRLYAIINGEA